MWTDLGGDSLLLIVLEQTKVPLHRDAIYPLPCDVWATSSLYLVPENVLHSYMRHVSALPTAPGSAHISPAYAYQDGPARKGSPRASKDGPTGAGKLASWVSAARAGCCCPSAAALMGTHLPGSQGMFLNRKPTKFPSSTVLGNS